MYYVTHELDCPSCHWGATFVLVSTDRLPLVCDPFDTQGITAVALHVWQCIVYLSDLPGIL